MPFDAGDVLAVEVLADGADVYNYYAYLGGSYGGLQVSYEGPLD